MRRLKLLLIAIIGVLAFGTIKVDAEQIPSKVKVDAPSGIKAVISKFEVYIRNGEGLMVLDESGDKSGKVWTKTVNGINHTDEGYDAYKLKNNATLITNRIKIEGGYSKLKEEFEKTVKEMKSSSGISGGTDNKYYASMSILYKLTLPSGITNIADVDGYNTFNQLQKRNNVTAANTNNGLSQMLISAIYDSQTDEFTYNDGTLKYGGEKNYTITSRGDDVPFFDEYYLYPNENINETETYRFTIHTKETDEDLFNSKYFLQQLASSESSDSNNKESEQTPVSPSNSNNNSDNNKNSQQISGVPDTDARNMSVTLFGSSLLALGSAVVLWELRKKFN